MGAKGFRIVNSQFDLLIPGRVGTMPYNTCTGAEVIDGYFYIGAGCFSRVSNGRQINRSDN
jgi:hypothetical protein